MLIECTYGIVFGSKTQTRGEVDRPTLAETSAQPAVLLGDSEKQTGREMNAMYLSIDIELNGARHKGYNSHDARHD